MSAALVPFKFRGDDLEVARLPDGDVGVPFRRLCEVLGLDYSGQVQRLRRAAKRGPNGEPGARWATVGAVPTVGSDGKSRSMLMLPRRSIPMWAATVDAARVDPTVRPKLVAYQDEAADALAERFLAPPSPPPAPSPTTPPQMPEATWELLTTALLKIDALTQTVAVMASGRGSIGGLQADWITGEVDALAALRVLLGYHPTPRAAKSWIQGRIAAAAEWSGAGARRRDMPADRYPRVKVCLAQMRSDLEAELARREPEQHPPAASAQTALAFGGAR
jgi:hypothetical protein